MKNTGLKQYFNSINVAHRLAKHNYRFRTLVCTDSSYLIMNSKLYSYKESLLKATLISDEIIPKYKISAGYSTGILVCFVVSKRTYTMLLDDRLIKHSSSNYLAVMPLLNAGFCINHNVHNIRNKICDYINSFEEVKTV